MNKSDLQTKLKVLANAGKSLRSINLVRIDDPSSVLPTSGEVVIKTGTYPEPVSQAGVNPWLRYETNGQVKISKTALLGNAHFSSSDGQGMTFRDLKSRTTVSGNLDDMFTFDTIEVNGDDITVAVPKVDIKVSFSNGGTVYVPAKTDGSSIVSFRKKDNYAMLSISKA